MTKRVDPRQMSGLLSQRERRGWSWAELARRSGVPVWKLRWWSRRLGAAASPRPAKRFAPVRIVAPDVRPPLVLEILLSSGLRILVPQQFDAEHLRRVIEAAGPGC